MVLFWNFFTKFGGQVYNTTKLTVFKGFLKKIFFSEILSKNFTVMYDRKTVRSLTMVHMQ